MGLAGPVAGLATGRARIRDYAVPRLINRQDRFWPGFVMANRAHLVSFRQLAYRSGSVGGEAGSSHAEAESEYTQGQQLLQALNLFSPYLGGSRS